MFVRKFKFKYKEDQDYGGMGWIPTWMKGANTVTGRGAAHDILEHHPTMPLGAECEFHALGALFWGRGEAGWFSQYTMSPVDEVIARDHISILERVAYEQETLVKPPRTHKLSEDLYGDADESLREIIRRGMQLTKKEWDYQNDVKMPIPYDADERILGWMRMGYRYAARRFGAHHQWEMSHLFELISKEVDKIGKHEDLSPDDELVVSTNFKQFTARVDLIRPEESYYY